MKKVTLTLILILSLGIAHAQESKTYTIKQTEWYLYNKETKEWDMQTQNKNMDIDLVCYKNLVNIQAKTPSLYRLDRDSKKEMETEIFTGYRYSAFEYVDMRECTVDVLVSKDTSVNVFVFSVVYEKPTLGKVNLRFFGTLE